MTRRKRTIVTSTSKAREIANDCQKVVEQKAV